MLFHKIFPFEIYDFGIKGASIMLMIVEVPYIKDIWAWSCTKVCNVKLPFPWHKFDHMLLELLSNSENIKA